MCVFYGSRFKRLIGWLVAMQGDKKEDGEKRRNPKHFRFLQGGAQTLNSNRSLDYARDNESIIYFNGLCKPTKVYIYASML